MNKWFFIIILAFLFLACKKQTEKKLIGTWHYYYLTASDTGITQLWTFNNPDQVIRVIYRFDSLFYDTGSWVIDKEFLEPTFITFKGLDSIYDGKYQILKLNKEFLFLQRSQLPNGSSNGAFLRLEFAREQ
ncbi:MAG: hypothetical protein HPY79_07940 [Bacteroidales bacterium]|nr:hypothetical protein [Bacteroidales bacterium]